MEKFIFACALHIKFIVNTILNYKKLTKRNVFDYICCNYFL